MVMDTKLSCLMSTLVSLILIASMSLSKDIFESSKLMTILGGFFGSILFLLIMTAVNNLENIVFGTGFQASLFPEVIGCLIFATGFSATVHRVCGTTCFLFSLLALYYLNTISHEIYGTLRQNGVLPQKKKRS